MINTDTNLTFLVSLGHYCSNNIAANASHLQNSVPLGCIVRSWDRNLEGMCLSARLQSLQQLQPPAPCPHTPPCLLKGSAWIKLMFEPLCGILKGLSLLLQAGHRVPGLQICSGQTLPCHYNNEQTVSTQVAAVVVIKNRQINKKPVVAATGEQTAKAAPIVLKALGQAGALQEGGKCLEFANTLSAFL